jgi:hypothetical protein
LASAIDKLALTFDRPIIGEKRGDTALELDDDFLRDLEARLTKWRDELKTLDSGDPRVWEDALIEIEKEKIQQMRREIADYEAIVAKFRVERP